MAAVTASARRRALQPAYDLARRQVDQGTVPFAILGVADRGGPVRVEAFGSPGGTRIGDDAVCLLASITKPITALGVLQLVEDGTITLDEPIGRWAPDLVNDAWAPITAWHVLTHTTGIDDVDLESILRHGQGRIDLLHHLRARPQVASPGTRFHYVSFTFDLLVEALARRTGEPYELGLRRRILDPLGMTSTTFDPPADGLEGRAAPVAMAQPDGSFADDTGLVRAYTSLHLAGGGLWSSADDLLRLGRAMLGSGELDGTRVVSPAFLRLMTREVTVPRDARGVGLGAHEDPLHAGHYALGWGRPGIASVASPAAFGHGGVSGTRLWIDPSLDLAYVYLSGSWGMPREPIDMIEAAIYAGLSSVS
ncbi:MAG TPA: serine hydrolase domain-containing protein [Candidatus Limnocylindrales bacterium]|nr:serine hydrolase domain-containing protein [Candidatus Limnocylindrales bacterium]